MNRQKCLKLNAFCVGRHKEKEEFIKNEIDSGCTQNNFLKLCNVLILCKDSKDVDNSQVLSLHYDGNICKVDISFPTVCNKKCRHINK